MTISTTTSRAQYAGNGVTTIFSFPYRFLANGDLEVTLFDAAGTPDPQALTTDYTVLGADNDAGGSVTMLVAPAVGETLVIRRVVALTQETDYISGDSFPAETHERALDRLTMADQQMQEQIDRSITLPLDDETFSGALPAIDPGKFLRVNDAGTALELVDVVASGDLVVSPFIETLIDDATAADARTTLGAQVAGSYAGSGAVGSSGLTMGTARGLGRITASTGAVEELTSAQWTANLVDAATESAAGKVEKLTTAEAQAGTDDTRYHSAATMKAAQIQLGTAVTLTNQTSVDFTSIPPWAKRITVLFVGVSTSGTTSLLIQIGDAGGVETTGYLGSSSSMDTGVASSNFTTGFGILSSNAASVLNGSMVIEKLTGNMWVACGNFGGSNSAFCKVLGGSKSLSDVLDRVRLTTGNGTDQYDAGSVNISWE